MKALKSALFTLSCLGLISCASAQKLSNTPVAIDSLAETMLVYQLSNGGWAKQYMDGTSVRYQDRIDDELLARIKEITPMKATIDNGATSREINTLIKAYKQTQNKAYLQAAERGIAYLLKAQYANGGWPQFYPDKSSYRHEITYNDNAMINVLNIMQDIATQSNGFEVVNASLVPKAKDAVARGLDCILKTQVKQNGKPSIWGAQYDEKTLQPAKARNFEPASLSAGESVGIVRFLMRFPDPTPEIKLAVKSAVEWFDATKIEGYKFAEPQKGEGRKLLPDASSTLWARFYDISTNKPIFGDRDNSIKTNVEELSPERRNGYAWYGNWAVSLLAKEYPKWLKTWGE
ncbi:MAG: pectate lyase [Sphingobacteriaceae bacterium]